MAADRVTLHFYRLCTIGWANPLIRATVPLLAGEVPAGALLDLSKIEFIDSFGVTYLAACLHRCKKSPHACTIRPPANPKVNQYLIDVGLYESVGLGEFFQARKGSTERVDMVHVQSIEPAFIDSLLDFLEHMQPFAQNVRLSMRLALVELLQNFAEHSGSEYGAWVAGQFHHNPRGSRLPRVTLCFLDLGKGIPNSMRALPKFRKKGDPFLIERSTVDGVSSRTGSRGLGLATIRRFARKNGGTCTIVAGSGKVKFDPDRRPIRGTLDAAFPGTAVFLSLIPSSKGLFVLDSGEGAGNRD